MEGVVVVEAGFAPFGLAALVAAELLKARQGAAVFVVIAGHCGQEQ